MTKVSEKVDPVLAKDLTFRQRLHNLVFSDNFESGAFENGWAALWFKGLFEARHNWVPAYFTYLFMWGLIRTTSRSEGENNFFENFTRHHSTLVEFFMHYDSAIESQRHKQVGLDECSKGYLPKLRTPLTLDQLAATVYTINILYQVHAEIRAMCYNCRVLGVTVENGTMHYEFGDKDDKVFK